MNKKLFSHIKDIIVAIAIAMLIWLYAEAENLVVSQVNFTVILQEAGNDVYIDDKTEIPITMEYKSSTGQKSIINNKLKDQKIIIKVSPNTDSITKEIDIEKEIFQSPQFKDLAINLIKLSKTKKSVDVYQLVTIELEIEISAHQNVYHIKNSIRPNTIQKATVKLPKFKAKLLENQKLIAVITKDTSNSNKNKAAKLKIQLPNTILPNDIKRYNIKITPPTIDVTYQVNSETFGQILEVRYDLAPSINNNYKIELRELDTTIHGIKFTATIDTAKKIKQEIKQGKTPLFAQISIPDQKTLNDLIKNKIKPNKTNQTNAGYSKIIAEIIVPDGVSKSSINVPVYIKIIKK